MARVDLLLGRAHPLVGHDFGQFVREKARLHDLAIIIQLQAVRGQIVGEPLETILKLFFRQERSRRSRFRRGHGRGGRGDRAAGVDGGSRGGRPRFGRGRGCDGGFGGAGGLGFGHGAVGCGYFFAQRRVDLLGADADALLGGLLADDRLVDHAVKRLHPQGKGTGERRLDLADLRGEEALPAELLLKLVQLNVLIFQL